MAHLFDESPMDDERLRKLPIEKDSDGNPMIRFGNLIYLIDDSVARAFPVKRLWPNALVPLLFDNLTNAQIDDVMRACQLWIAQGIELRPQQPGDKARLRVVATAGSNVSTVTARPPPTIVWNL